MLIPLKKKYRREIKVEGYTSKHNDGTRRRLKNKVSDAMKKRISASQPKVTLVVNATGKRRFVKENK